MNDILKWLLKVIAQLVIWVFILSISWGGKSLFTRANEVFVQNALVAAVDEELADLWSRVRETAKTTFSGERTDKDKSM